MDSSGKLHEGFAANWGKILDAAYSNGLAVIVTFALWGDWNTGDPDMGWEHFSGNPLNRTNGGPASTPAELLVQGATQTAWLNWMSALVERWQARPNIIAWEVFSELDLLSGATEFAATEFLKAAAAEIATRDLRHRPVFASTSDLPLIDGKPWTNFWHSAANDLVSLHPYYSDLDRTIRDRVRECLALTDKPILVGEAGLSAKNPDGTTETSAPNASIGLRHAIWSAIASGAANARAFWWEDGYAVFFPEIGESLVTTNDTLESTAAYWLRDMDFSGVVPLAFNTSPVGLGAALGNSSTIVGWLRKSASEYPTWSVTPVERFDVRVELPPQAPTGTWKVEVIDPFAETLPLVRSTVTGKTSDATLTFTVTDRASMAFRATPQ
jgi:hypothetical protein